MIRDVVSVIMITCVLATILGAFLQANVMSEPGNKCRIYSDSHHHGLHADCRNLNLTEFPENLPLNITSIDLSNNIIKMVKNYSCMSLTNLWKLDLNTNRITCLEALAFYGCNALRHLDLSHNQLALRFESYPPTLFDKLVNLQWLNLQYNSEEVNVSYPDRIFKNIHTLNVLKIDTDSEPVFGRYFGNLNNLQKLILGSDKCGLEIIRNHTFLPFSSTRLEMLDLSLCNLDVLEPGAFLPLNQLKELYMEMCPIGVKRTLQAMSSPVGRSMRVINLKEIHLKSKTNSLAMTEDAIIKSENLKYLSDICIEKLTISRNNLLYINMLALVNTNFSSCLTHLDASVNRLTGDFVSAYSAFQTFEKLKYFDISLQEKGMNAPFIPPNALNEYNRYRNSSEHIKTRCHTHSFLHESFKIHTITLYLPKHLEYFNVSVISSDLGPLNLHVIIKDGQSLTHLNASFIGLRDLTQLHVQGIENLRMLDLSGNGFLTLPDSVFDTFPNVESLHLNYFSFPQDTVLQQGRRLLQSLPKLKMLSLSFNQLSQLPPNMFEANPRLKYVDLSRNVFSSLPFEVLLTPNLQVLDITFTSVGYLDSSSRTQLDTHTAVTNGTFTILSNGNLFSCGCGSFAFLVWLKGTDVILDNHDRSFPCLLDSGEISNTALALENNNRLWRKCIGISLFYISLSTLIFLLCGLLVVLLIKTNKTTLVYIFMNLLRPQIPKPRRRDFRKDLYVSYADADYQFVCHRLRPILEDWDFRLFLWHRDSLPGDSIPDQIAENMPMCWKIILYVTANFEKDTWGYVSMMAAINCVDNVNPERVMLILTEEDNFHIPNCLLEVIPEKCIFRISPNTAANEVVWEELMDQIVKED